MPKLSTVSGWTAALLTTAYAGWRLAKYKNIRRNRGIATGQRILILGGGFGGREAAEELARLLPQPENGAITLVDARPHLLFTPMLTEVVGGDLQPQHITNSVDSLPARVKFIQAKIESIDLVGKAATLEEGQRVTADHLVIALGSSSNFHHDDGVEAVALTVKSIDDAKAICRRALQRVEEAGQETDPQIRKAMLTFVVAGGGYTGVETMAALNGLVRDEIARNSPVLASQLRTVIVEPSGRLMAEVTPDLAAYSQKELEKRGIEVLLNVGIKGATKEGVSLTDGREIACKTLVWSAGIMPSPVVQKADGPKGKKHGLQAAATLAVAGNPGVWAIGDCAEIPQKGADGKEKTYAPTAQNATREGVHVARNIVRSLRGEELREFSYTPIGELAVVGKRQGVARIYGHNFSGIIAWALWRGVYLAKMPGGLQRILIASDWLRDAFINEHSAAGEEQRAPSGTPELQTLEK